MDEAEKSEGPHHYSAPFSRNPPDLSIAVAAIIRPFPLPTHVLITRRPLHTHLPGMWELPGGKVRADESIADALHRELAEELGIKVDILGPLGQVTHEYDHGVIHLHAMLCTHRSGELRDLEVLEHRWVDAEQLAKTEFPPANAPLTEQLLRRLRAS